MQEVKYLQVSLPRGKGHTLSKIFYEDSDKYHIDQFKWRLSKSGYVVRSWKVGNRVFTEYLHKRIFGATCYHINGDRLDNRRDNLRASKTTISDKHYDIIRHDDFSDVIHGSDTGMACIEYSHDKIYAGRLVDNKPHGIGILTMNSSKQILGLWKNGNLITGMIMNFDNDQISSDMAAMLCPQHLNSLEFVEEGLIVKTIKT